jgi:hypothetical protein
LARFSFSSLNLVTLKQKFKNVSSYFKYTGILFVGRSRFFKDCSAIGYRYRYTICRHCYERKLSVINVASSTVLVDLLILFQTTKLF